MYVCVCIYIYIYIYIHQGQRVAPDLITFNAVGAACQKATMVRYTIIIITIITDY